MYKYFFKEYDINNFHLLFLFSYYIYLFLLVLVVIDLHSLAM